MKNTMCGTDPFLVEAWTDTKAFKNGVSVVFNGGANYEVASSDVPDKSRRFIGIFDSFPKHDKASKLLVKLKWEEILKKAKEYEWAEWADHSKVWPENLKNWPKSKYMATRVNSNVFVREVVKAAGLKMKEMQGMHTPATYELKQNPVPGSWLGVPWHKDVDAPPPPK